MIGKRIRINKIPNNKYDAIILAVSHNSFLKIDINFRYYFIIFVILLKKNSTIFDQFVTDTMNDFEQFSVKKAAIDTKN